MGRGARRALRGRVCVVTAADRRELASAIFGALAIGVITIAVMLIP